MSIVDVWGVKVGDIGRDNYQGYFPSGGESGIGGEGRGSNLRKINTKLLTK